MSKKKKKNSNYSGKVDTKGVNIKKEAPKETFWSKYKKQIIIAVCAVLLAALVVGIVLAAIPKKSVYVEMDFGSEYGKIIIEVERNQAPKTAKNFIDLVESGFYNGLTIFRAQQNFVIQGGKNDSVKLTPIEGEFESNGHKNNISHTRGVISMARTNDPNSATSQFFITLHDQAAYSLDGSYAGFGYVVEGMDVVDKIANALFSKAVDSMGFVNDADAIKIVSAKVIEYNK
ncbi:MAG: peptidylprolyl isomerase [Clostridia bacterium]|nr:peptidylprolyl isomerase [Clostridia bacterium]